MLYLHKNILCHTQYRKYQISQIAFIQDGEINTLITELKFAVRSSLDISHTFIHCTQKANHSNHLYTSLIICKFYQLHIKSSLNFTNMINIVAFFLVFIIPSIKYESRIHKIWQSQLSGAICFENSYHTWVYGHACISPLFYFLPNHTYKIFCTVLKFTCTNLFKETYLLFSICPKVMMANTAKIKQGKKIPLYTASRDNSKCQQKFNDEHICNKGPKPNLIVNQ